MDLSWLELQLIGNQARHVPAMRLRLLQTKNCHSLCPFPSRSHCLKFKMRSWVRGRILRLHVSCLIRQFWVHTLLSLLDLYKFGTTTSRMSCVWIEIVVIFQIFRPTTTAIKKKSSVPSLFQLHAGRLWRSTSCRCFWFQRWCSMIL